MSDVRTAIRALRKSPGFTLVAILTIAVGIGANTTLFSVYDRLVLNPVTIPSPSIARRDLDEQSAAERSTAPAVSWPRYEELRDAGALVLVDWHLGVRQLHADRQRRSASS